MCDESGPALQPRMLTGLSQVFHLVPGGRRVGWRMPFKPRITAIVGVVLFAAVAANGSAQRTTSPPAQSSATQADATRRIVSAAQALLAILDEAGRAKVQFPFEGPQTTRWS